jgi:hypothetical protein
MHVQKDRRLGEVVDGSGHSLNQDHVTKIKTIMGIPITNVSIIDLKKFCGANNVFNEQCGSLRKAQKHVSCERIVWHLEHPEEAKRLVRKNSSKNINRDELQVNRIRLMNVLFSDAIRPILHTRNEPLHKDDMTDGMVSGQKFWSKIANEYNSDNVRYKFIAHANINVPRNLDPSNILQ